MGLAAFNRMRRIQAEKEKAKKRKAKPVEKMNKSELITWLKKNKGITIADPENKTRVQLMEMTTMTFGDMVNDLAVDSEASIDGEEPLPPADDTEKEANPET